MNRFPLAAAAAAAGMLPALALGQPIGFPSQPIRVVVPAAPGGMSDLLGGHIQVMFENVATAIPMLQSGKVRARWTALGILPLGGSPWDAARRNAVEAEKWRNGPPSPGPQESASTDTLTSDHRSMTPRRRHDA